MQVGEARSHRAPRIDDDDFHFRPPGTRFLDPPEEHRVREGGVRARDEKAVGVIEVLVAIRRRVDTERGGVAGHGRGHAQARIGVDIGRTEKALRELVEDVIVLGEELAGYVEGDRVGAMLANRGEKASGDMIERLVPRDPAARLRTALPHLGMASASRHRSRRHREMQCGALGAQLALAGRVIGVSGNSDDAALALLDHHAAAGAAVAAGRADFAHGDGCTIAQAGIREPAASRGSSPARAGPSMSSSTSPFTTRTSNRSTAPWSGATANPDWRSMHQLWRGQATLSPKTMPCESGPPLCGQRSCSANTASPPVRKIAIVLPSPPLPGPLPSPHI